MYSSFIKKSFVIYLLLIVFDREEEGVRMERGED
jgi:hypothetical protein